MQKIKLRTLRIMEHPFSFLSVLLLMVYLNFARCAPQPLSLLNETDFESTTEGVTSASNLELNSTSHSTASSTPFSESSSTPNEVSTTEIINPVESKSKSIDDTSESTNLIKELSSVSKETSESSSEAEIALSATTSIPKEDNTHSTSNEDTTILRYIPPLDPMKHMLMMAENKKIFNISEDTKEEEVSTISSTSPESESSEKSLKDISTESTNEIDVPKNVTTLNSNSGTGDVVKKSGDLTTETIKEVNKTELLTSTIKEGKENEFTTDKIEDDNVTVNPTEKEITVAENISLLLKNSEVVPVKVDGDISTSTVITTDKIIEDVEPKVVSTISPITENIVLTSTQGDHTIKPNETDFIGKESLARSDEIEMEAEINASTSKDIDVVTKEADSKEVTETYSNTDATTSEENLNKLSISEGEKPTIVNLDEELKFRDANITLEDSNVVYSDLDNKTESEEKTSDNDESIVVTESNITAQNDSTTTMAPDSTSILTNALSLLDDIRSTIHSLLEETKSENETIHDSIASESESDAVLREELPDILKVELEKAHLDSISTSNDDSTSSTDTSTEISSTDDRSKNELISTTVEPILNKEFLETENREDEDASEENLNSLENEFKEETELLSHSTVVPNAEKENDPKEQTEQPDKSANHNRYVSGNNTDTIAAVQFLHYHDKTSSEQCFKLVDAHWNYATNLTEENKKRQLEQTLEYSLFHKSAWKNATSFAWKNFNDTHLRRWFKSLSVLGTAALPEDKLNEFNRLKAEMKNTYSTAKVCPYISAESKRAGEVENPKDCNLTLEPDLQRILTKSRDYDELAHVWKSWRDAAGKPIREKYLRFVNLSNEAARLNGFPDTGDMWRESYESETFKDDLEALWNQLKPLYEHLHAYVRRKLVQQYGSDRIKENGPIPAHLFGNMWAQSWVSLLDITQPFTGKPSVDVTPIMEAKNLSALEMFKISEEFFTSLGLKEMPEEFWQYSLIEKPKDREIICHASAWDFCNGKDYRIKQCTDITMEDLITVHHEMGHIQYFLQYSRQPNVFREGANPGFHEAIGDVLALSVSTPNHLQKIGLLEEVADDPEGDLNFLLRTALDKVSFLPSGYLIDLWRWGLFSGDIQPEEMNTKWWDLRLKYQGICPPVKREDTDFDPGAKYHVPGNVPYIRYFVSFVIQFQFHKVLCDAAGHTGPLYKCDIYRSKEAGQILSQVMELGSSQHWSEAMKIMTGGATNKMDAGPILEYFQPLLKFLEEQNQNETLGWMSEDSTICP